MFVRAIASSLLFILLVVPAYAQGMLTGKVVGISDGDTLTLLNDSKQQIKVRLAEIDTPEAKQPFGTKAKQKLSDLAFSKQAEVKVVDTDRYGRTVGRVYVNGLDVNAEMVKSGAAWVYVQYAKDASLFVLEKEARDNKRGLWALPESQRQEPWEWRKEQRKPKQEKVSQNTVSPLLEVYKTSYLHTAKSCCKICDKGKPCGDSCISKSYTCRKPVGCAC